MKKSKRTIRFDSRKMDFTKLSKKSQLDAVTQSLEKAVSEGKLKKVFVKGEWMYENI